MMIRWYNKGKSQFQNFKLSKSFDFQHWTTEMDMGHHKLRKPDKHAFLAGFEGGFQFF